MFSRFIQRWRAASLPQAAIVGSDAALAMTKRAMEDRLNSLTEAQRREILARSSLEAAPFQGTGFHILRKNVQDLDEAHVDVLGEVSARYAEDWIIARWLEEHDP
jgi:hypothetical protein